MIGAKNTKTDVVVPVVRVVVVPGGAAQIFSIVVPGAPAQRTGATMPDSLPS
jgi:hypothetical protein